MDKALEVLEDLGAIDARGSLTALGRHIVRLKMPPHHLFSHARSRCFRWTCGWQRSVRYR
jgi:HrpA-like RNA helicase